MEKHERWREIIEKTHKRILVKDAKDAKVKSTLAQNGNS